MLQDIFDQQLFSAKKNVEKDFDQKLKKLVRKDAANDKFYAQSEELYIDHTKDFVKTSASLIIEGSGWGERVQQQNEELQRYLKNQIETVREKEMEKLRSLTIKATYETIEEIVNEPIYSVDDNFWELIGGALKQEVSLVSQQCREILRNGFKTSATEENEFIDLFMDDIKKFTQDYIKRLFRDVNTNLLRRFKKEFEQDENGKRRNWVLMETEQIQDVWGKCKKVIEEGFKHFKYIELSFDLDPSITTPGEPIDPQTINLEEEKELLQIDGKTKGRSNSMLYGRLLSETEINKVRDRFNEDTQNLLDDAMRKHVSTFIFIT